MTMIATAKSSNRSATFLRRALLADAVTTGATGVVLTLGAGFVTGLLGLSAGLMQYAGLSLLPFAALVAWVGTRQDISRTAAWAIVAYNTLWAIDSVVLLATGWVSPTVLGAAFVIVQALIVAGFAVLQFIGLRQPADAA